MKQSKGNERREVESPCGFSWFSFELQLEE